MFRMTAQVEYAYVALVKLAEDRGKLSKLADIAAVRGLSEKFMLQTLTELKRAGLVESRRGKNGGYFLAVDPEEITFADLLAATASRGGAGFDVVGRGSFLARWWASVHSEIHQLGQNTSLADAMIAERGSAEQPMYYI